jgi:hypothetical protein
VWIGLLELSLPTGISIHGLFEGTYEINLWHVYTMFSAYFHKFSKVAYENSL